MRRELQREPIRARLYPVFGAVSALLVAYGVLTEHMATLWVALANAILGVFWTERARQQVTPVTGGKHQADSAA